MLASALLVATTLAWQPPAMLPATRHREARRSISIVAAARDPPKSFAQQKAEAEESRRILEAAEDKLDALNEVGKAPTSWADAGLPPEAPAPPAVPAFVSAAPLVVGGFSLLLFTLNAVGLFGEGPDLDALVEELSNM